MLYSASFCVNRTKHQSMYLTVALYGYLQFWFVPHQEISTLLFETYEAGMRIGDVDNAIASLTLSLRFSLFGGMNLSLLSQSYFKHLKQIVSIFPLFHFTFSRSNALRIVFSCFFFIYRPNLIESAWTLLL